MEYFFDAITNALTNGSYTFDLDQLEQLVNRAKDCCSDKRLADKVQSLIQQRRGNGSLNKSGNQQQSSTAGLNIEQFKQSIIEMYNTNPLSVTRILELTKELDVQY